MRVIHGLGNLKKPLRRSIVTIGVFDGVHIGHRSIIRKAVSRARYAGAKSVVLTFDPHPMKVLKKRIYIPSLISPEHKAALIEALGADYLVILKFTRALGGMRAEEFVKKILLRPLGMKEIYIGEDFYFGKGGTSGREALQALAGDLGFKVRIVKPVKRYRRTASSSIIRGFIRKGDIKRASAFLGRPVSVLGTVVGGSRRGRILGFPTANINPHHEAIPPSGVYAVKINFNKKRFKGVLNIGTRPTFPEKAGGKEPRIEAHIFGFNKRIYGRDLEILFASKIRDEVRFKDRGQLVRQIKRDAKLARSLLR